MSVFCVNSTNTGEKKIEEILKSTNSFYSNPLLKAKYYNLGKYGIRYHSKNGMIQFVTANDSYLIFIGELYNKKELILLLEKQDYNIKTESDAKIMLAMLDCYGKKALDYFNGAFSFVYLKNDEVLMARDHVGIRSLYYAFIDDEIIISNQIKGILPFMEKVVVDKEGISELMGMGPSLSLGKTIYKDIHQIKPGSYATFSNSVFEEKEYFFLIAKDLKESFDDAKRNLKDKLDAAIKSQCQAKKPIATLLSGGLDSTIITMVARDTDTNLKTYSIDYQDNLTDYQINSFETSNDQDYLQYVIELANLEHTNIIATNDILVQYLEDVVKYRDGPGMTTIDSSLYHLSKSIRLNHDIALSGECSDELLGGYPWYYKDEVYDIFPWIRNIDIKQKLLHPKIDINLDAYVKKEFNHAISNVDKLMEDDGHNEKRTMYYLNVKYFMPTLLARASQISEAAELTLRVPFASRDIVEYLYNMDFKFKYHEGIEKYILREAYKEEIPFEVFKRKKSPYPKSQSKQLKEMIYSLLQRAIADNESILQKLVNISYVEELMNDADLDVPWFGQLLRKTELFAYLYQIHIWGKLYEITLEI